MMFVELMSKYKTVHKRKEESKELWIYHFHLRRTQCYGEEYIEFTRHIADGAPHEQRSSAHMLVLSFVVFPFTCCNLGYFQVTNMIWAFFFFHFVCQ